MSMTIGTLVGYLEVDDSKFIKGVDEAGSKWSGLGQGLSKVGATLTKTVTLPMVALGAAGLKSAADIEQGMNEVFTLLPGLSEDAMGKMTTDAKAFSKEMGVLPNETIPALYQAISAGVPADNVFDFLETAQKAALGGVTDLTTAVDGISSVVNAYGSEVLSATEASDLMFTAVKLGKTTFGELASSLYNVIPTTAALGVGFGDVTAALASMTAQGVPTSVATTQLRQLFVELSKEGTKTSDVFKDLAGVGFRDFIAAGGDTQQALQLLEQYAANTGVGINDLFGSVEAGSAALALTGKGTEKFSEALDAMAESAGATERAYNQMDQGVSRSLKRIKTEGMVMLADLGEKLLPVLEDLLPIFGRIIEKVGEVLEWFGGLDQGTQNLILALGGIVLAAGPVLSVLGKILPLVGPLTTAIGNLGAAAGTAGAAGSIGLLTGALVGLAAVAVAIGLAKLIYDLVEGKRAADSLHESVTNLADGYTPLTEAEERRAGAALLEAETAVKLIDANNDVIRSMEQTKTIAAEVAQAWALSGASTREEMDEVAANVVANYETMKSKTAEALYGDDGIVVTNQTAWNQAALDVDTSLRSIVSLTEEKFDQINGATQEKMSDVRTTSQTAWNEITGDIEALDVKSPLTDAFSGLPGIADYFLGLVLEEAQSKAAQIRSTVASIDVFRRMSPAPAEVVIDSLRTMRDRVYDELEGIHGIVSVITGCIREELSSMAVGVTEDGPLISSAHFIANAAQWAAIPAPKDEPEIRPSVIADTIPATVADTPGRYRARDGSVWPTAESRDNWDSIGGPRWETSLHDDNMRRYGTDPNAGNYTYLGGVTVHVTGGADGGEIARTLVAELAAAGVVI